MQNAEASHIIRVSKSKSNNLSTGAAAKHVFNNENAPFYCSPKTNSIFFRVRAVNGAAISENRSMNFL